MSKGLKGEGVSRVHIMGRAFQAEGTAGVKAQGWECTSCLRNLKEARGLEWRVEELRGVGGGGRVTGIKTGGREGDRSREPSLEWSRRDGRVAAPSSGSCGGGARQSGSGCCKDKPVGLVDRLDVGGEREEPGMTPRVLALMTGRMEGPSTERWG